MAFLLIGKIAAFIEGEDLNARRDS